MMSFLRLVRYQNLLIIIITQYAMRWLVIAPLLRPYGMVPQLSELAFILLVLSTVFIAAAGYTINDYFDRKIDLINRPDQVVVSRQIDRRQAIALHLLLNGIGVTLGIIVSLIVHMPLFGIGFIFIAGVLWFYSTTYKRQLIIGNLVISFLTALVPFIVVLFEVSALRVAYFREVIIYGVSYYKLFGWVGGFSIFAFLTTLIREIIKDTEDFEGDNAFGLNTLPIEFGIRITKTVLILLTGITLISLVAVYGRFLFWKHPIPDSPDYLSMIYILATIFAPLVYLIYAIGIANKKSDYTRASYLVKFVMFAGITYTILFNFFVY